MRSGRVTAGDLPAELTSFVGRRRELVEVRRELTRSRLVTLIGVGGTGKTRLAVRVAHAVPARFPDGLWFVDLAQLPLPRPGDRAVEPGPVAALVAVALGLPEVAGLPPVARLTGQLGSRCLLIVLDNCEHVLPACATVVEAVLGACPEVTVLATSRRPLTVPAEVTYPVPPLPVPDVPGPGARARVSESEAVALFVARAGAVMPGFALTPANQVDVARLCRGLDGLPLAIELAAARIPVLAPGQIVERLADRFGLLRHGARDKPPRQQTLYACLDWSYELCTEPQRLLWARSAVFTGGFEPDAVRGVCADRRLPAAGLDDLVAALTDASVLVPPAPGGPDRYRMLESIRDFGQDRLRASGALAALRRRHRDWYTDLLSRLRAEWIGDRQGYWVARMAREGANVWAAIEYCLEEPGEAEGVLRLAVALPFYFWSRGLFSEGRRWLAVALARADAATPLRARALVLAGGFALVQGDAAAGLRLLTQGQQLAERLGDPAAMARATFFRGMASAFRGAMGDAAQLLERALTLVSSATDPDPELRLDILHSLGVVATWLGDWNRAVECHQAVLEATGGPAVASGQPGEGHYRCRSIWGLGLLSWRRGDLRRAERQVLDSLRIKRQHLLEDRYLTGWCLETLAWITADLGGYDRAAHLLGAAESVWVALATPLSSSLDMFGYHEECSARVRAALGDARFEAAFLAGRSLRDDEPIRYALGERRAVPGPAPAGRVLTGRERQVAELIGQGLTNQQIAARLVVSRRTVESHVSNILTKLGFTSRTEVAGWLDEDDPG